MTDSDKLKTLKRAIEIVVKNGWMPGSNDGDLLQVTSGIEGFDLSIEFYRDSYDYMIDTLLFDLEFCKALWGEEETIYIGYGGAEMLKNFELHIQQMALSEDRIQYLKDNIKDL